MSEYQERNIMELDEKGNYYMKHIAAMTKEDLRSKSDIAAELGYRDMTIERLTEENRQLREALSQSQQKMNTLGSVMLDDELENAINNVAYYGRHNSVSTPNCVLTLMSIWDSRSSPENN